MTLRAVLLSKQAFESESGHIVTRVYLNPHDFATVPWSALLWRELRLSAIHLEWYSDPNVSRGEVRFAHA